MFVKITYFIASKVLVKPLGKESAYLPDVLLLNKQNLKMSHCTSKSLLFLKANQYR